MWRVEDSKQMAALEAKNVQCLAVSKDGRWIAAGTSEGYVFVWDAKTYRTVFTHWENDILGVDFSPDSTRLVSASKKAAIVWDIATRKRVHTLEHADLWVRAAKYSPQGDRVATATRESVRLWDGSNGRLLVRIPVTVAPLFNTGLLWFKDHLFVISTNKVKEFESSTGSAVSEWPVADTNDSSCIALPKHGEFIAYSTQRTVTFCDTAIHTQLGLILHLPDIRSIAVSPDDRFLANGGEDGKVTINGLSHIIVSTLSRWIVVHMNNFLAPLIFAYDPIPLSHLHRIFQEPDIRIDDAALHSWKHNQLANANVLLTTTIHRSRNPSYDALASRALVRARLRQWDAAVVDATQVLVDLLFHVLSLNHNKSIKIQPSVIGYIARSVALVGKGESHKAYRTCDIAFQRCHSDHVTFLLLIKVCHPCIQLRCPSAAHIP